MAETISLEAEENVPKRVLTRIYKEISPNYVKRLLKENNMPTNEDTVRNVTTSYSSFPTQDLALKAFDLEKGMKFWGIASGYGSRKERVAVKYLILEHIQEELNKAGISSEINIADLNSETIDYMQIRGIFKGKLPKLRKIAEERGNLENITLGLAGAMMTPV